MMKMHVASVGKDRTEPHAKAQRRKGTRRAARKGAKLHGAAQELFFASRVRRRPRWWLVVLLICVFGWWLVGCDVVSIELETSPGPAQPGVSSGQEPVQGEQPIAVTLPPTATPLQPTDSGWMRVEAGIELRRMRVLHRGMLTPVAIVRLDPALVHFHAGYAPAQPQGMAGWCAQEGLVAAINGGFFDEQYAATALVISGGTPYGSSYQGQGGMFAVDTAGQVSLRYLAEQPYQPGEPLREAIQSWPMLVLPGGRVGYSNPHQGEPARRSVLALDRAGRVLLMVFPGNAFTLHELGAWLLASDMEIDAALNLDGGSSTGMCVQGGGQQERIDAFSPLPIVLMVGR